MDLTGNRDMSIEGAPNRNDAVAAQSNNILQNLLGISQAQAAPTNSQNDVDLPGTVVSRGLDRLFEWSKSDWDKSWPHKAWYDWATDGRGIDLSDGPDLDDMLKPEAAKKIREWRNALSFFNQAAPVIADVDPKFTASGNTDAQPTASLVVEKAINAGGSAWKNIQEQRAEEAAALEGAEGDAFLLGGAIEDFLKRPGIQNMLEVMQQPEFIEGSFTSGALGPYARAKAGLGSRETEGLEAYAKYLAAQPGPVELTGEIGKRADSSLAGKTALDMVKAIRNIMQSGHDSGENITGIMSGLHRYGGNLLSLFHATSEMSPQHMVESLKATLLERYVKAMGLGETRKVEYKKMLDQMITVKGLFRRDEDVLRKLAIMEQTLQEQTTLNTRLLGSQGYDINQLTQPIPGGFGTYDQSN